jgi:hypothetical protein
MLWLKVVCGPKEIDICSKSKFSCHNKRRPTCAEPRSNMFPANTPLTRFSRRLPPSSMASLRRTTSANRDIAFAFSSSYQIFHEDKQLYEYKWRKTWHQPTYMINVSRIKKTLATSVIYPKPMWDFNFHNQGISLTLTFTLLNISLNPNSLRTCSRSLHRS